MLIHCNWGLTKLNSDPWMHHKTTKSISYTGGLWWKCFFWPQRDFLFLQVQSQLWLMGSYLSACLSVCQERLHQGWTYCSIFISCILTITSDFLQVVKYSSGMLQQTLWWQCGLRVFLGQTQIVFYSTVDILIRWNANTTQKAIVSASVTLNHQQTKENTHTVQESGLKQWWR